MGTGPADTLNYMIGGYAVIFLVMVIYVGSLIQRFRRLQRDEELLKDLRQKRS